MSDNLLPLGGWVGDAISKLLTLVPAIIIVKSVEDALTSFDMLRTALFLLSAQPITLLLLLLVPLPFASCLHFHLVLAILGTIIRSSH